MTSTSDSIQPAAASLLHTLGKHTYNAIQMRQTLRWKKHRIQIRARYQVRPGYLINQTPRIVNSTKPVDRSSLGHSKDSSCLDN